MKRLFTLIAILVILPGAALADSNYSYSAQGIFGCNQNGSYAMSVGAMSAQGGVYVPVSDAAVTLNTGTLVYLECILRPVVDSMRMSATAALTARVASNAVDGRNGKSYYLDNLAYAEIAVEQPSFLRQAHKCQSSLNDPDGAALCQAAVRSYLQRTQDPWTALKCPDADPNVPFSDLYDSHCDAILRESALQEQMSEGVAQDEADMLFKLQTSNGFYGVEKVDQNGKSVTVTPGYVVGQNLVQAEQSGFTQLQNASDIGQMVSALYAGLASQVVNDPNGLTGVVQSASGQSSYLDQMASQEQASVRSSALNAGLQILAAARQVEATWLNAANSIANYLTNAIGQLRGMETQCWGLVVQHVCASAVAADNTCTDASGNHLKVATSTAFSQAIISQQIAPLATPTVAGIQASQSALTQIDQLIKGATNSSNLNAQQSALQQLDALVAQHKLHTQNDLSTIQSQQQSVHDSMTTLIDNTKSSWADSTDPNVGWCNINNQAVIDMWDQKWKI